MSFPPVPPTMHVPPTEIAPDTFVVHQVQPAFGAPLVVYINSMVIRGAEPVVIDTGTPANRTQWLEDVFALVEPEDVKWIFLSHDDVDHSGNLDEVMTACPNATLVCSWATVERHTCSFDFPLDRLAWVTDGMSFDAGDRTLHAVRPPVFDSPTTRGLFDPTSGVYWAVDTFAVPLPDPAATIADLEADFWTFGLAMFAHGGVSPWLSIVDADKYAASVERVRSLGARAVASCHSPVLEGDFIEAALGHVGALPTTPPPPLPDQAVLDGIVAAMAQPPGTATEGPQEVVDAARQELEYPADETDEG